MAEVLDGAGRAVGGAGGAGVAAVEDEPVVRDGDFLLGDVAGEDTFGVEGRLAVAREADTVCHTEDMGVNGQGGQLKDH